MFKPLREEKGQSIIIIALILVSLIALIALVVDVGNAYAQRRIVQNAADSAAIAAARELARGQSTTNRRILLQAQDYAERNGVPRSSVTALYTDMEGNVLGEVPNQNTRPPTTLSGKEVAGVQVSLGKYFNTFFAGVVGRKELPASANSAGVVFGGACTVEGGWGLFPMAVEQELFEPDGGKPKFGQTYRLWDKSNAQFGNFGWLSWDNDPSEKTLVANMNDTSRSGKWAVGDEIPGGPGVMNSAQVRQALDARIANNDPTRPAKVILPIYDYTTGTGNNLKYHIIGFGVFVLTNYNFQGNNKWVEGYFVQEALSGGEAGCLDLGTSVVKLRPPVEYTRNIVGNVAVARVRAEKISYNTGEHVPVDVVNVLDISGSMDSYWGSGAMREKKIATAKRVLAGNGTGPEDPNCSSNPADPATWFDKVNSITKLNQCVKGINNYLQPAESDQLGLATYPSDNKTNPSYTKACGGNHNTWYFAKKRKELTSNIASVNTEVNSLSANGATPIALGVKYGREILFNPQFHKADNVPVLIVATDGMCNVTLDGKWTGYQGIDPTGMGGCNALAEVQSIDQANLAKQQGAIVFTIAVGKDFAADLLKAMATYPAETPDGKGAHFFQAGNPKELAQIYDQISQRIENIGEECLKDWNEVPGSQAYVALYKNGAKVAETSATSSGSFAFSNVAPGTYELRTSWVDPATGIHYDVMTESVGGLPVSGPVTIEVKEGTGTYSKDLYLSTDEPISCE
ncbi:MAG: pilus assembly protein TadG-related protein [Anaerolineae bacterium]